MKPAATLIAAVLGASASGAPSPEEFEESVAVHVGRLLVGNGEEKENVTILITGGKIEAIGENVELPHPCTVLDCSDSVAMPGLIHPESRLGLLAYQRSGSHGDLRVADEFLPDPEAFDEAVEAGFTTLALCAGGSQGILGRAMVVRPRDLGEGMVVAEESYLTVYMADPSRDKKQLRDALKAAEQEIEKVKKAREEWEKKKKAAEEARKKEEEQKKEGGEKKEEKKDEKDKAPPGEEPPKPEEEEGEKKKEEVPEEFQPPEIKPELRPFVDMIEGRDGIFLLVHLGGGSSYLHFLDATKDHDLPRVLRVDTAGTGSDAFFVKGELAENEEVVVLDPAVTFYPYSDNRMNIPRDLVAEGVKVAFCPGPGTQDRRFFRRGRFGAAAGPSEADSAGNLEALRYNVAELIRGGLPRDEAVQALTLRVAEALGLHERLGSVETGKDGNLLILSGDPFDVQSEVEKVVLEGTVIYDRDEVTER